MSIRFAIPWLLAALQALALAQIQMSRTGSVLGTITAIRVESAEIEIQLDQGGTTTAQLSADTLLQRVAPGQKDLSNAEKIQATDLAPGDRVLVNFVPDSKIARRMVVMSAASIARRNEADREDWLRRGVAGVVAEKKGNEITLRLRSFQGETQYKVLTSPQTTFRRYAPGSVKFSDAKASTLAEIRLGDQLRARGQKTEDGTQVTAEEVVFGSFVTKAGEILSVDPEQGLITAKEVGSGKKLLVKIQRDSQIKRLPTFGGGPPEAGPGFAPGMGMRGPNAGPPGGFPPVGSRPPGEFPPGAPGRGVPGLGAGPGAGGGPPAGPTGGPPAGGMGPRGPGRDFSQMIERLPAVALSELKPGETIVFSSTVTEKPEEFTAIVLVGNAEFLVRMATMQQAQQAQASGRGGMPGGGPGFGGGLLEFPSMIP
ncbi:MAG: hypothetical protein NZV14_03285 [Bryobacteraceae bacterium]|nr:hypothetical protein [Bryobacteraceae bacterium]MDW8377159.1 hypothetical protein [Bryobacterales bacterium]